MKSTITIKSQSKPDFLMALFLTVFISTRIIPLPSLIANMFPALCGCISFLYVLIKKSAYKYLAILISILMSVFMMISIIANGNCNLFDIIWIWAFMGIAMILFEYNLSYRLILFQYWCFVGYIILKIAKGDDPNTVIYVGSENNISVYLLLYLAVYFIVKEEKDQLGRLDFFAVLIGLAISMWSASRAGALCFAFLFVCLLSYYLIVSGKKIKVVILIVALVSISYYFVDKYAALMFGSFQNKIMNYGNSSLRTDIWKEYFYSATNDFGSFFFGPDTHNAHYHWLSFFNGNTHNAFLMLHSHFGLIPFIIIIPLLCRGIYVFWNKGRKISSICLASLLLRSCFDWTAFPGIYDIFYYLIIMILQSKSYFFLRVQSRRNSSASNNI